MRIDNRVLATHAGVLVGGLIAGFFLGREYLKYEIRETFSSVASAFSSSTTGTEQTSSDSRPKASAPASAAPSPIAISLLKKDFREHDYEAGIADDAVTFELAIQNNSNETIRAFDGTVTFTDLLGNEIISSKLAINDPVAAHQRMIWDGELNYNEFIAEHQRFRGADAKNMKIVFAPGKILFASGRQEAF